MTRILIIFGVIIMLCGGLFAQQSTLVPFQLLLDGRLISGVDPTKLISSQNKTQISNFSTLTNMEYIDGGIRGIRGMTQINSSSLVTHPEINNLFHFVKSNPSETHLLIQSFNSAGTQSVIYRLSTTPPTVGSITADILHTDASGVTTGRFSDAPIGHIVYCNGEETPQVWGGLENKPGHFSIFNGVVPSTTTASWSFDYTQEITNSLTDAGNIATLKRVDTGNHMVGVGSVSAYLVARMPIQGAKFYVGTANTRTGSSTVTYWNGSTFTAVSNLVDNTASGGITLAQTGSITFDSTEATARVKIIDGIYGYFYRFQFADATDTATISQVTIDEAFQNLVDFWDGQGRSILSAQFFDQGKYIDVTTNVFKDEFSFDASTDFDESTYFKLTEDGVNDLATSEYLYLGFGERMTGVNIKFIPQKANTAVTVLTVSYWDGDSWESTSDLADGTFATNTTFAHDGNIIWTPLDENVEFRRSLKDEAPVYYYRLSFSAGITAVDTFIYHISGIPVQKEIGNYKFSLNAQGRLWLFNNQADARNSSIVSDVSTLNVFNGEGAGDPLFYGGDEEVQAAIEVHSRTTAGSRANILVFKNNQTYLLKGIKPEEWEVIEVSNKIGCNAPLTLVTSSIGIEHAPLQSKQVAIWQGNSGIYMWDSTSIIPISDAISNYFDQSKPEAIEPTRAHLSRGFFETHDSNHYYHWLFSSKATSTSELNEELVFDIKRQGWFRIDREDKPLQVGVEVVATDTGVTYAYGAINSGDIQRLDDGTDFDGTAITSIFETADIPLSGNIMTESKLRYLRMIMKTKSTTSNSVNVTHYVDGNSVGESFTMSPARSGYRLAMPIAGRNQYGTFHRFRCTMTTSDETIGFEPFALGGWVDPKWREVHN